jgi:ubiquinone/menaquinone biosynthesis C-methylase UbiE
MKTPEAKDWSIYWTRPTVTSFGNIFPENYDDAILEFWKTQLVGEFRHVVDVACGNGALTWIANDILNGGRRQTRITGVDFANISPFRTLQRNKKDYPSVRFMGNTPAETLPFRDGSIDMVISQYGVEYADLEKTIPELARVLTDAGRMSFVLHDEESVIVKGAMLNLEGFRLVLNEIAIHEPCLRLVELGRRISNPAEQQRSAEYQGVLAQINESANRIRGLTQNFPPPSPLHLYMDRLNYALNEARTHKKADQKALIAEARDGLQAHVDRIDDLAAAALSEEERRDLVSLVERQGFTVTEDRALYYEGDKNFGTILAARR